MEIKAAILPRVKPLAFQAIKLPESQAGKSTELQPKASQTMLPTMSKPFFGITQPRFSALINEDYNVIWRRSERLNAKTISAALQAMLSHNAIKKAKEDPSTLKFFLDGIDSNNDDPVDRAALADTMALTDRPVDVIVREVAGNLSMLALQSATGKRMIYAGGEIILGPAEAFAGYKRYDDHEVVRELQNEYVRDLEYKIMQRAGIKDRAYLFNNDLNSSFQMNSLQALAKGENGLVDAVIVGFDRVVTREDLDKYLLQNKLTAKQKENFLSNYHNVYKIPSRLLAEYSPQSIPKASLPNSAIPDINKYMLPSEMLQHVKKNSATSESLLTFYEPNISDEFSKVDAKHIPLSIEVHKKDIKPSYRIIENIPNKRALLEDDVVFFNDDFDEETGHAVATNISLLDQKKRLSLNPSNIKILVNSPGGTVWSGLHIRNTIHHAKTKVDVIVTGEAASCGAFLMSSATGNRFMTKNARLMIHDTWRSISQTDIKSYNQGVDSSKHKTILVVDAVARASGRTFKQAWKDMKINVYMNPLEAIFYGPKGLCDAILVGDNKAITKQDVYDYLVETLGSEEKADKAIKKQISGLRVGKDKWKPEDHNENDPFENPLKTIEAVAAKKARDISEIPQLKDSVPRPEEKIVDYRIVAKV